MVAVGHQDDAIRGQGTDEGCVVADQDERPLILVERLQQGFFGLRVEVVGRLVEKQHIGSTNHQPGQCQLRLLPTR